MPLACPLTVFLACPLRDSRVVHSRDSRDSRVVHSCDSCDSRVVHSCDSCDSRVVHSCDSRDLRDSRVVHSCDSCDLRDSHVVHSCDSCDSRDSHVVLAGSADRYPGLGGSALVQERHSQSHAHGLYTQRAYRIVTSDTDKTINIR